MRWRFYFNSHDPENVQVFDQDDRHIAWGRNKDIAALISAAPDLLEAAKSAIPALEEARDKARKFGHTLNMSAYTLRIQWLQAAIDRAEDRL